MKVLRNFAVLSAVLLAAAACSTAPGQDIVDAIKGTWKATFNGIAVTAVVGDDLKVTADANNSEVFTGKRDGVIKSDHLGKDVLVYKGTGTSDTFYFALYSDGKEFWTVENAGAGITDRNSLKTLPYIKVTATKQ